MRISILTISPRMLDGLFQAPIVQHALNDHKLELEVIDLKEYAPGSFRAIDDSPYGGGAGMILRCQPILDALKQIRKENSHVILLAPIGQPYVQETAHRFVNYEHLIIICGHYEGIDARVYERVDEIVSLGDFIVSGGEFPATMIVDSIVRLMDGVIKKESIEEESFENGLLEYPQYTKPAIYDGMEVPEVLRSGNHQKIAEWKKQASLEVTKKYRPDLIKKQLD